MINTGVAITYSEFDMVIDAIQTTMVTINADSDILEEHKKGAEAEADALVKKITESMQSKDKGIHLARWEIKMMLDALDIYIDDVLTPEHLVKENQDKHSTMHRLVVANSIVFKLMIMLGAGGQNGQADQSNG